MKKLIVVLMFGLLIPNVFAWFPEQIYTGIMNQYSELCVEKSSHRFLWMNFTTNKYLCNKEKLDKIRQCNQEYPKDYSCQLDVERQCYRDCLNLGLEYDHFTFNLFSTDECWCTKEGLPFQIR